MSQVMIIARMKPDDAPAVADIFGQYDGTPMPYEIGVSSRSLYRFHDLYVHLVDFSRPQAEAMATAQAMPEFRTMSEDLRPFINAYDPNWKSPRDAMANRFYRWDASPGQGPDGTRR